MRQRTMAASYGRSLGTSEWALHLDIFPVDRVTTFSEVFLRDAFGRPMIYPPGVHTWIVDEDEEEHDVSGGSIVRLSIAVKKDLFENHMAALMAIVRELDATTPAYYYLLESRDGPVIAEGALGNIFAKFAYWASEFPESPRGIFECTQW